ncbi:MAG: DUF4199 domain-containing protein [Acidobacteria bacterium]|nr:MAG: DUF4199 domain-containing protein [Acidobacteriota bacterium]REJ98023.1 MAG: DUF4199 domain-containing protein [Acidobacteriota bacterium]REK16766.1 MAG: DUF4199 domain-containing protein [Acidobacteriota bacterium]REK42677.1 MAG: DUF4199 domain-containing protein [Acidobacteriota bacterium]
MYNSRRSITLDGIMKNYILRYGIAGGLISIVLGILNWFTVAQWFGPIPSQTVGWLSIILSLMCIPLGMKYFRDKLNDGSVGFGEGLKIGLGITAVVSVLMYFYSALFFLFQGEEFVEWTKRGLSTAELAAYEQQIAQSPAWVYTPWVQALLLCISIFVIGLVISVVSALLLKSSGIGEEV